MALTKCKECGKEVSTKAESCPNCGAKLTRRTIGCGTVIGFFILLAIIGGSISSMMNTSHTTSSSSPTASAPKDPKALALASVQLKYDWYKGGFDNVMFINATIQNKGANAVKDIEITCTHSANSGTVIDRNKRVIYEAIRPNTSKTLKGFDMGFIHSQAARSNCEITDLVVQ